jgi:hypothetical protein
MMKMEIIEALYLSRYSITINNLLCPIAVILPIDFLCTVGNYLLH